jgi:hypothetical protein
VTVSSRKNYEETKEVMQSYQSMKRFAWIPIGRTSGPVSALPAEQRRLIEQLFWGERTETEVADAMGTNQSTINCRKQAILDRLRMKLRAA